MHSFRTAALLRMPRVLAQKARPFDFLLVNAECTPTARSPSVIVWQPHTGDLQDLGYSCFVDPCCSKGEMDPLDFPAPTHIPRGNPHRSGSPRSEASSSPEPEEETACYLWQITQPAEASSMP